MFRFALFCFFVVSISSFDAFAQASAGYSQEPELVQRGEVVFQSLCASCHTFERNAIGPELSRVFFRAEKQWIFNFIKDPQAVIDSGDARARELQEKYSSVMPSFGLSDADIEAVLAYMYANRRKLRNKELKETSKGKGLEDPIPEKIADSGIVLELEAFCAIPPSSETLPVARINKLAGVHDKGEERIFVNDQRGVLYEIVQGEARVFLDLAKRRPEFVHTPGLATGFSSFAFSPEFESDGLFYTQHAESGDAAVADIQLPPGRKAKLQYVVTEWQVEAGTRASIEGEGRELLRIEMVDTSHGMQELAFDPYSRRGDRNFGLLYIGVGDGGASYIGRPDLIEGAGLVWGTVLRIAPQGTNSGNGKYGIPGDNPFADGAGGLPEVFAHGFRNPNALSWSSDGSFYVADIGHWQIEELNRVEAGKDYGWPRLEGTFEIDLLNDQSQVYPRNGDYGDVVDPLLQVDHDEMMAIAGGFVYEGSQLPLLKGTYLFGDIATGRVLVASDLNRAKAKAEDVKLSIAGNITSLTELAGNERGDLRVGRDAAGEPYFLSKTSGTIWKVVGASRP
ncbi:PQQ-dependent sugar dehydrogenase [Pelagicoccus sp. NFK12]|uniref:PQQ-dependent sugar dehydrogenase n=1 Tax=Pelagicoccus enzymogenes TaxID=2773457 RepID=A0A927IJN9_9BACT|nr:PQQ-dependent sugar dehydrogenase [Pelagicoccus enzymogenes]MBD5781740.1 PQQ-dependent sugar dehydrogenase [Pelagicoccus enzymogenes]